eukprot:CAMPEP_0172574164 /NCGR_PEP_ID=MMETSP1067-20121228/136563_1 /TAXON_ID=265564 ORGANISM="Thalassiosira punctigera, Strain Tpunct2005C2" /NCGR_SAMPLE_ID=MMETSP1067 /ASSEMBLY_ACC=CAM_ASM_000444 /LENGTH=67 /DNA_ID=CAMNT_0013366787 /DNA_START=465 /DNA_END=668 /DNA_ORIENTATION=+
MTLVLTLIRVPPSVTTAFVQVDEDVRARVAPRQWDTRVFDGLKVLIFFGLGAGGNVVVAASHDGRLE